MLEQVQVQGPIGGGQWTGLVQVLAQVLANDGQSKVLGQVQELVLRGGDQ